MNLLQSKTIGLCFLSVLFSSVVTAQSDSAYLFILGVVQDAGFPQTGCYEQHCIDGWRDANLRRGATSISLINPRAQEKFLFEATPNFPEQLYQLEQQAPDSDYSLAGVFLSHAHIGHYAGLMFLGHEAMGAADVPVFAMPRMNSFLRNNGPWSQLVQFNNIELLALAHEERLSFNGIAITPFLVPHRDEFSETVGYRIEGPEKSAVFIPDINKWSAWEQDIREVVRAVDYALIDATFYADGELGNRDMSQIPHPFVSESMAAFAEFTAAERNKVWFIHMNHTNPLLNSDSEESQFVRSQGFNVASEGVKLPL